MKQELKKVKHHVRGRRYQDYLKISPRNRAMIAEFLDWTRGEVCPKRHKNYERYLWLFADVLECDFDCLNEHDARGKLTTESKRLMQSASRVIQDSDYSSESVNIMVAAIKVAFKHWFGEDTYAPDILRFLKRRMIRAGSVRRQVYSEEELDRMLARVHIPAWRFYFAYMAFDSGARPCELRRLRWRDLDYDEDTPYFHITTAKDAGNTYTRPVLVQKSAPEFRAWRDAYKYHKKQPSADDFVFLDHLGKPFTERCVTTFFKRLRERAGLDELTALTLRRSWITRKMCDPNITTAEIQSIVGQKVGGQAIASYVFLDEKRSLDAQRRTTSANTTTPLHNQPSPPDETRPHHFAPAHDSPTGQELHAEIARLQALVNNLTQQPRTTTDHQRNAQYANPLPDRQPEAPRGDW